MFRFLCVVFFVVFFWSGCIFIIIMCILITIIVFRFIGRGFMNFGFLRFILIMLGIGSGISVSIWTSIMGRIFFRGGGNGWGWLRIFVFIIIRLILTGIRWSTRIIIMRIILLIWLLMIVLFFWKIVNSIFRKGRIIYKNFYVILFLSIICILLMYDIFIWWWIDI